MEYKNVKINDAVSIPVPLGMSEVEEASYIACRIPLGDLNELEAEYTELLRLHEAGQLISLDSVLSELQQELTAKNGKPP